MATYRAEIKVTPTGSFFPVTIESGALSTAKDAIEHIYNPISMQNLREVRGGGGGGSNISMSSGNGGTWLVGLLGGAALLLYFTPWILMLAYGAGGTWIAQKLTGQTIQEYTDTPEEETTDENHKKAGIVFSAALFLGMIGFIHGTAWNKDLNKEYNLDGNQPQVQQVQQK
jgi:hypothetical protein